MNMTDIRAYDRAYKERIRQTPKKRKIFAVDAESDGLFGFIFAVGAVVMIDDVEVATFGGKLASFKPSNEWVRKEVVPVCNTLSSYTNYYMLLKAFHTFYKRHAHVPCDVVCHMGHIVEGGIFRELELLSYPLYDVVGNLQQIGEDPTSCDKYFEKYALTTTIKGSPHNPLYDAAVTAAVYNHLCDRITRHSENI